MLNDPGLRQVVYEAMADPDIRTYHPALVVQIATLASALLRGVIGQPGWENVDPADLQAVADYLELGPSDRIPDDATALALIVNVAMVRVASINPGLEGRSQRSH